MIVFCALNNSQEKNASLRHSSQVFAYLKGQETQIDFKHNALKLQSYT